MAKKDRCPDGYYRPSIGAGESEYLGDSGHIDTAMTGSDDSGTHVRKCINLNYDKFGVPLQVHPVSKMSSVEKKSLLKRLGAELEQIRLFRRKIESHRMSEATLSASTDILSCSSGHNRSALLNSGKEKRENFSVPKGRGWNRGSSGRFEAAPQPCVPSKTTAMIMKQCETLLKNLMSHRYGWVFNEPVDVVKLNIPDYLTIIKHPMDFGTIKGKLASGVYSSPHDFASDMRLTFSNAITYNPPGHDAHVMALALRKQFEVRWKSIEKKLPPAPTELLQSKVDPCEEVELGTSLPPAKKMKIPSAQHNFFPEPTQKIMTGDEKTRMTRELEDLLSELPDSIIDFLKSLCSNGADAGDDVIEIDLDAVSHDKLFQLRKLLDDYIQDKQKNQVKTAERCEIELLHGSGGLSNSSIQPGKGMDPAEEEDVDICGSEPPVSSYPLVEIDKGSGHSSDSESSSSSSDSESDSDDEETPFGISKVHETVAEGLNSQAEGTNQHDDNTVAERVNGVDYVDQNSLDKQNLESQSFQDGEKQILPEKLYRAALLKSRFADTILKAKEKTLSQDERGDPEKLRREREELELQQRIEKARLVAEAQAAETARKQAEAEAAAEARRRRELEREAARQALQQMEKTVEINENCRILEDLEMLRAAPDDNVPSSVDETSPDHSQEGLGGFRFTGKNPLEQLGLYMKQDEDEEEADTTRLSVQTGEAEEGKI